MDLGIDVSRGRCATVWAVATLAAAAVLALLLPVLAEAAAATRTGGWRTAGFEPWLVWGCAAAAAAATCWLWLVTTVVSVDTARGTHRERRGVPVGLRTAVWGLCGVALTSGLAAPALASGGPGPEPQVLAGLRLPERVSVAQLVPGRADEHRHADAHRARPPSGSTVTVAPGDTLWAIAAQRLGPGARDVDIAAYWPAIYAVNRDVIGADPGLIVPGQRLVLPPSGHGRSAR